MTALINYLLIFFPLQDYSKVYVYLMLQVVEDMRQKQHKVAASQGNSKLINNFEFKKFKQRETRTHNTNYPNTG